MSNKIPTQDELSQMRALRAENILKARNPQMQYATYVDQQNKIANATENTTVLSNQLDLKNLIVSDYEAVNDNRDSQLRKLMDNIRMLSNEPTVVQKIYDGLKDKLTFPNLSTLNQIWNSVVIAETKKTFTSGIKVDDFVSFVFAMLNKYINKVQFYSDASKDKITMQTQITGFVNRLQTMIKAITNKQTKLKGSNTALQTAMNKHITVIDNLIAKTKYVQDILITSTTAEQLNVSKIQINNIGTEVSNANTITDKLIAQANSYLTKTNAPSTPNNNNTSSSSSSLAFVTPPPIPLLSTGTGVGRYKKPIIFGKGANFAGKVINLTGKPKYVQINKYYIDMDSLKYKGILKLKYVKNRNILPTLPITYNVSTAVRSLIEQITEDKFNIEEYNDLTDNDKNLMKAFLNACHIQISGLQLNNENDDETEINILYGEYHAGNKSVLPKLKKQIKKAMLLNKISAKQGILLLNDLE